MRKGKPTIKWTEHALESTIDGFDMFEACCFVHVIKQYKDSCGHIHLVFVVDAHPIEPLEDVPIEKYEKRR